MVEIVDVGVLVSILCSPRALKKTEVVDEKIPISKQARINILFWFRENKGLLLFSSGIFSLSGDFGGDNTKTRRSCFLAKFFFYDSPSSSFGRGFEFIC